MTFTELHRQLGLGPSPLTDGMIDAAIDNGVVENDALDWKSAFPSGKLAQSDFPKDVAALANSGGGIIVYGVKEAEKAAIERTHVACDENLERTVRAVAVSAITPPVFGLKIVKLGTEPQAVAVIVPNSVDGPHLIYKGEHFAAPRRNDADTTWMKEREVAAAYRARFDEQRRSNEVLESLYDEALGGRDAEERAWLIAVARPRVPGVAVRPTGEQARVIAKRGEEIVGGFCDPNGGVHPLPEVWTSAPRPGVRRWMFTNAGRGSSAPWNEAWLGIHHDGSVSLAVAVGAHRKDVRGNPHGGGEMMGSTVEAVVADFAAVIRASAEAFGHDDYEVLVGIEWEGQGPIRLLAVDDTNQIFDGNSTPLTRFVPIRSTIDANSSDDEFHRRAYELVRDCINQGGLTHLRMMKTPPAVE